jgi:hypothetical protein
MQPPFSLFPIVPEASGVLQVKILDRAETIFWLFTLHRGLDLLVIIFIQVKPRERRTRKLFDLLEQATSIQPIIPNQRDRNIILERVGIIVGISFT